MTKKAILSNITTKVAKNGNTYADITLMDKDGQTPAKFWNYKGGFNDGDVVEYDGKEDEYNGKVQIIIQDMKKIDDDPKTFYLSSRYDKEVLTSYLSNLIELIKDQECKTLVQKVFEKKDITDHPAAKSAHHAYLHGLLEHTYFVAANAYKIAQSYTVNTDLVITAALLHDVGKVDELTPMPALDYTDNGNLIGHIAGGAMLVKGVMEEIKMDPKKQDLIIHCILAHHGELENGSPKIPVIPEAMIIHFCDNIDAKMKMFETAPKGERNFFLGVTPMSGSFDDLEFK